MEDGSNESKEEHTVETPGQEEGNFEGSGNPYAKKGWTDDTNGGNSGDGGGGPGLSNSQSDVVCTVFARLERKADEGPGFVLGKLLNDLQCAHPNMVVTPIILGPNTITNPNTFNIIWGEVTSNSGHVNMNFITLSHHLCIIIRFSGIWMVVFL